MILVEEAALAGISNAPPPFKALVTFTEDGGLVIAVQGDVTTDPPFVNSSGHGAWVKTGKRTFVMTFLQLSYTLDGTLRGIWMQACTV